MICSLPTKWTLPSTATFTTTPGRLASALCLLLSSSCLPVSRLACTLYWKRGSAHLPFCARPVSTPLLLINKGRWLFVLMPCPVANALHACHRPSRTFSEACSCVSGPCASLHGLTTVHSLHSDLKLHIICSLSNHLPVVTRGNAAHACVTVS